MATTEYEKRTSRARGDAFTPNGYREDERITRKDDGMLDTNKYGAAHAVIGFIILALIIWVILWLAKFNFTAQLDQNGQPVQGSIDNTKAIIWSILIAAILAIIFWALNR